jgi:hypothetical protein
MTSKNTLLGSGKVEEVVELKVPIDELPDVALPTWMRHKDKKSILANTKKEYYDAVDKGFVMAPGA